MAWTPKWATEPESFYYSSWRGSLGRGPQRRQTRGRGAAQPLRLCRWARHLPLSRGTGRPPSLATAPRAPSRVTAAARARGPANCGGRQRRQSGGSEGAARPSNAVAARKAAAARRCPDLGPGPGPVRRTEWVLPQAAARAGRSWPAFPESLSSAFGGTFRSCFYRPGGRNNGTGWTCSVPRYRVTPMWSHGSSATAGSGEHGQCQQSGVLAARASRTRPGRVQGPGRGLPQAAVASRRNRAPCCTVQYPFDNRSL